MIRYRHSKHEDSGFTTIELLVAMIITTVIGGVVTSGIVASMQVTRRDTNRQTAVEREQQYVERISRDLRIADPLRLANPQDITVDTFPSSKCVRIRYVFQNGLLQSQRLTYNNPAACNSYPATVTANGNSGLFTLLPNLVTTGSNASQFTYYNDAVASGTNSQFLPTTSTAGLVTRVTLTLTKLLAEGQPSSSIVTDVELRNHT